MRSTCSASNGSRRQAAWRSTTIGPEERSRRSAKRSHSGAARRSPTSRTSALVQTVASRLDELSLLARERRLEAELRLGRHADVLAENPRTRRGPPPARAPARSADARPLPLRAAGGCARGLPLGAGHAGRGARDLAGARPAGARGTHPAPGSRPLAAHRRDVPPSPWRPRSHCARSSSRRWRRESVDSLLALAEPLARQPRREIVVVGTVTHGDELAGLSDALQARRAELVERGLATRAAAFTSMTPGADLARLAIEHDVDLLLVDAPGGLLEDARVLTLLDQAPSDVAIVAAPSGGAVTRAVERRARALRGSRARLGRGGGWSVARAEHELPLSGSLGASEGTQGRDASRLLADASLAIQHAFGVPAEPLLVEPDAEALLAAASDAGAVVVGLTERWRREGLGPARTALATRALCPHGSGSPRYAPQGLAPRGTETHFTWTIAAPSAPQANLHRIVKRAASPSSCDAEVPRPDHRRTRDASHESRAHGTGRRLRDRARGRRSRCRQDLPGVRQADHCRRRRRHLQDARRADRRLEGHVVRGARQRRRCITRAGPSCSRAASTGGGTAPARETRPARSR